MADDKALKMVTRMHGDALRRDNFDAALYGTSESGCCARSRWLRMRWGETRC